jgi:hypothetical protein
VKQVFKMTNVKSAEEPKKKVTGSTRNAFLREQLQTTAKVTGASILVPTIQTVEGKQRPVPAKPKLAVPNIQKVEETQKPVPGRWNPKFGYGLMMGGAPTPERERQSDIDWIKRDIEGKRRQIEGNLKPNAKLQKEIGKLEAKLQEMTNG